MKRILLMALIPFSIASGQKIRILPVTRDSLGDGLTIILMEYHKVPVINLRLVVRGGSAHDPENLPGLASMMASLMKEGTTTRTSAEISEVIEFVGGSLSVAAGLDYSAANMEVMKKDIGIGLELFTDVILNPSFPEDEIERQKSQRLANLDAMKEDPSSVASIVFSSQLYGRHPYGNRGVGTRNSIRAITRDELTQYHKLFFVPNRAVLVAVGDFDPIEMLGELRSAFSPWDRGKGSLPVIGKPQQPTGRKVLLVNKPDATQTQIRIGSTGIAINDPDYFPVIVANTIFGAAFTSRLMEELRVKRSLTYGVSSNFSAYMSGGGFVISTFTKNETIAETIDVILDELTKIRQNGVTEQELRKGRNYLSGEFARILQTPEALASNLTDIELFGFPSDYLETYIERIQEVTMDDVRRAVENHFPLDDLLMTLVGPTDSKERGLSTFGPVVRIELDEAIQ